MDSNDTSLYPFPFNWLDYNLTNVKIINIFDYLVKIFYLRGGKIYAKE